MNHGSLFSGIGGFDLAAQWMGWENKFHCEWDKFCKKILKYYWPDAESYGDIDETDFTFWRGLIDVLTGGFPCQPYSTGGNRKGKDDPRHKWPQMLRAIREIQPRWVVAENVRGLTNWNNGLVFDEVQADMEAEGYKVIPFLLPACGVNAPHRRDRIWFIAYCNRNGYGRQTGPGSNTSKAGEDKSQEDKRQWLRDAIKGNGKTGLIAIPISIGQQESRRPFESMRSGAFGNREASWSINVCRWPVESPVYFGNDGFPLKLDGITLSDWAEQSLKGTGNAVVPQVVFEIFKAIESMELINRNV